MTMQADLKVRLYEDRRRWLPRQGQPLRRTRRSLRGLGNLAARCKRQSNPLPIRATAFPSSLPQPYRNNHFWRFSWHCACSP